VGLAEQDDLIAATGGVQSVLRLHFDRPGRHTAFASSIYAGAALGVDLDAEFLGQREYRPVAAYSCRVPGSLSGAKVLQCIPMWIAVG
jgi:hypothetical protein